MRRRHSCTDLFSPRDEFCVKLFRFFWLLSREVLLLAHVIAQVVKLQASILEVLHELPFATLDCPDRRGAPRVRASTKVAREMLVYGVAFKARACVTKH